MRQRDRNKPLIEESVLKRQIEFQAKLIEYQHKHVNMSSVVDDDIGTYKKAKKGQAQSKVKRGNLGFCSLDMSLINLPGIPSLWMDSRQYCSSGSTLPNGTIEPYIKPYQKKLIKKQHRVHELLKLHKIFENEKYFGKTMNYMHNHNNQNLF